MNEHYDAVIAEFRRVIAEAEAGIRAIERLRGQQTQSAPQAPVALAPHRPAVVEHADQDSIPNRIVAFLQKNPSKSYTATEISDGIGGDVNLKTLRGALSRNQGTKIRRSGRGKYRAIKLVNAFDMNSYAERPEDAGAANGSD